MKISKINNLKQSKNKYYFFALLLALILASCNDNIRSSIPDYPVYLELNLTSTYPTFKNSVNQFLVFKNRDRLPDNNSIGFGGVIVFSDYDSGNSIYYAFDMACPYEVKSDVKVFPDVTGLPYVVCEKCGSVFNVSYGYGNPISGPAKEFLKRYRATLSGDVLYINR